MIKLHDLKNESLEDIPAIKKSINSVIESGIFLNGPKLELFQEEFASYIGTEYCVGLGNGTDAIEVSLLSCGVNNGDEVLTVANAGGYAATAIYKVGAKPIYIDVDGANLLLDLNDLSHNITDKTKAIIVTHLYGTCVDVIKLRSILGNKIKIIEDCSHAHGSIFNGIKAGSMGDCAVFSFYPTKALGSFGSGGAIVTNSYDIYRKSISYASYGWDKKYSVSMKGGKNSKLDEFQSAILAIRLRSLDKRIEKKREIASIYRDCNQGINWVGSIEGSSMHLCVLSVSDRDSVVSMFTNIGIETGIHYPIPDYMQPAWLDNSYALPNTEAACNSVLSIPLNYSMSNHDISKVISGIEQI